MIQANRIDRGFFQYQKEFEEAALRVLRSGYYILGPELLAFEEEFASYIGSKYAVGLASGLDALKLAFRIIGLKPGDEVIVQGNAYIACVMGITENGGVPVFVEPDEYYNIDPFCIEEKITERTKAVLVVHLYGQAANMERITDICKSHGLRLIEDCAQSHGAGFNGQTTGTFGDIGCFSFYPTKNMGAFGDGGALVTDDPDMARQARVLRNYGSEKRYYNSTVGLNSRLDELQAALLRVRLSHIDDILSEKQEICERYLSEIKNSNIILPKICPGSGSIWHQFVIRCNTRERLIEYLKEKEIGTIIHYPIPPHLSEAYEYLGHKKGDLPITEEYADTVLSIPLYNGMIKGEIDTVISALNEYRI